MKPLLINLFFIGILSILIVPSSLLWAQEPYINIDLQLEYSDNKINSIPAYYIKDKQIIAKVRISNLSNEAILINKGFLSQNFISKMQLIGPTGYRIIFNPDPKKYLAYRKRPTNGLLNHLNNSLVGRNRIMQGDLYPFSLPYGYIDDNPNDNKPGVPIRFAPCEKLPKDPIVPKNPTNLVDYYNLELPGYYSARVQVSAMIFRGGTCNVDVPQWMGLLSSNTVSFYLINENNKVKVKPSEFNISGVSYNPNEQVSFLIKKSPETLPTFTIPPGCNGINIYLNYNEKLSSIESEGEWCIGKTDLNKLVKSLGRIKKGENWISIAVRLRNGLLFGGSRKYTISGFGKDNKIEFVSND